MKSGEHAYQAAVSDGTTEVHLRHFFTLCRDVLEENEMFGEAFCFRLIADHLETGMALPITRDDISRLLGL